MERYDLHMHLEGPFPQPIPEDAPERVLAGLASAGLAGGCLFSPSPRDKAGRFVPYEERMQALEAYTRGQTDRLFPVFWIHPDEPDAEARVMDAHRRGVAAFKFICDSYYVGEEKCLRLMRLIASLNKPVIFHSGILWYGGDTSKYNRPLNWEALIDVPGLRFSMGHCSWPWHDECIAMYGKFLNHLNVYGGADPCEMFFDITPGTPPIYRRDLLFKLFNVGYDVENNIMYGTDSIVPAYSAKWVMGWMRRDDDLYRELGVPEETVRKIYRDNLLRFLGRDGGKVPHRLPQQTEESPA